MLPNILDSIDPHTLGLELQAARKRKGMRQEDAAKIINVGRTTMIAIEKGERRVTAAELVDLAMAYEVQVADLVRPRPTIHPTTEQFRGPATFTEEERRQIEPSVALLIEYARSYVELEELRKMPLMRRYPAVYPSRGPVKRIAESIAIEERQRLGLGDGPLPASLRDTLEQYVGLRIFYMPLPKGFSEIYLYDESLGGCIAVNRNHPEERRRLSLSHGFLHFLAHRFLTEVAYDDELVIKQRNLTPEEQLAEKFPPPFLMPEAGLIKRYNDIVQVRNGFSTTDLLTLAHLYGVSVQALTLRLEDLDLLPTGRWESLQSRKFPIQQYRQQLNLHPLQVDDDIFPLRYRLLAYEALIEGDITQAQFAGYLHTDRLEARAVAEELAENSRSAHNKNFDARQEEAGE